MIKGLTHDSNGVLIPTQRFSKKIATGYAPGSANNKSKAPKKSGYLLVMKEVIETSVNTKTGLPVNKKKWVTDVEKQKELVKENKGNEMPSYMKIVFVHKFVEELWTCRLASYSATELLCYSEGKDTIASQLIIIGETRKRIDRTCQYHECPDFIEGKCSEVGHLAFAPTFDFDMLKPYKFDTTSIVTIKNFDSILKRVFNALNFFSIVNKTDFNGLFGCIFWLRHIPARVGGFDTFISELIPDKSVMEKINSLLPVVVAMSRQNKAISMLSGSGSEVKNKLLSDLTVEKDDIPNFSAEFGYIQEDAEFDDIIEPPVDTSNINFDVPPNVSGISDAVKDMMEKNNVSNEKG